MTLTKYQIEQLRKTSGLAPLANGVPQKSLADKLFAPKATDFSTGLNEDTTGEVAKQYEKLASFTGGKKIGQGLGQALYNAFGGADDAEKSLNTMIDTQSQVLNLIKEKKAKGEDVTRLQTALTALDEDIKSYAEQTGKILNQNDITGKQVLGDAIQLGTTVVGVGSLKGGAKVAENKIAEEVAGGAIKGTVKGAVKGAKEGVKLGAGFGTAEGLAKGLKEDGTLGEIAKSTVEGTAYGALFGGAFGTVLGGISGGLKGKQLNDAVIKAQEESGIRPTLTETVAQKSADNPKFASLVSEAEKQGFSEKEINFLATVQDADKPILKEMFDVTAKAQSNPRQIRRASDILGDNATKIVQQIEKQNSTAGKAVDKTAKSLVGQVVDATPVRDRAMLLLEDVGVTANKNGTPNWSKSIFNKTPAIQKKLMETLSDLPVGEIDAYDLHKFKKSIDEVVNYGVGGEGLKGQSANILKQIRRTADDILDTTFSTYNEVNTEYKTTREFLDKVREVVGKKVDFSSKQGGQSFGQAFRSAFSNNKSRPRTLALIEDLQAIATERNLTGAEQNLLDQAIYINLLEDTFGSQASTGLAGEVKKGVASAKKLAESSKNPKTLFETGLNIGTNLYDKAKNITPESRKQVLETFLK